MPFDFDKELSNIFFLDEQNGWITGKSYFAKTTDGGDSWIKNISLNFSLYNDVYFSDFSKGWLTVDSNRTLKTTNGGSTWQLTNLKGGKFITVDVNNVYLSSDKGLYYSSNKGMDWTLKLDSSNAKMLSTIPKVNSGWGVVDGQTIFKYFDTAYYYMELDTLRIEKSDNSIILLFKTFKEHGNYGFDIERAELAKKLGQNWFCFGTKFTF